METNLLVAVKCSRGVGQGEELGGGSRGREQGGQGSPSRGSSPGSAPFPDSHLQGQDAVVPHKRLAVTTSFRSLSGFPATIKGHVRLTGWMYPFSYLSLARICLKWAM